MSESVTFTREQLYELVWQKPIARLAEGYSISNVGLAKIKRALRDSHATSRVLGAPRGRARAAEAAPSDGQGRPTIRLVVRGPGAFEERDELLVRLTEEKSPENRITVPDRLHSPCELVQAARAALQAAKGNSIGLVEAPPECLAIHVSRDQLPRALRVADALLKAFAERGWNVAISREQTFVRVDDMPIGLRIDEGSDPPWVRR